MIEKFLLDANVPMYAAGREHKYKESCSWILMEVAEQRINGVIDTEIIQEILYRYGAIRRWESGVSISRDMMVIAADILPVSGSHMSLAIDLFEEYAYQGIPARDALHVAVMISAGIKGIISTDSHFDRITGVERIDPLDLFRNRGI